MVQKRIPGQVDIPRDLDPAGPAGRFLAIHRLGLRSSRVCWLLLYHAPLAFGVIRAHMCLTILIMRYKIGFNSSPSLGEGKEALRVIRVDEGCTSSKYIHKASDSWRQG